MKEDLTYKDTFYYNSNTKHSKMSHNVCGFATPRPLVRPHLGSQVWCARFMIRLLDLTSWFCFPHPCANPAVMCCPTRICYALCFYLLIDNDKSSGHLASSSKFIFMAGCFCFSKHLASRTIIIFTFPVTTLINRVISIYPNTHYS